MADPRLTRRGFLIAVPMAAGGLALGLRARASAAEPDRLAAGAPQALAPNPFVHVASDGTVTITCHRSEMGQGIRSTLHVLLAEELGADLARVKLAQADGDPRYGDQNTDGSSSIRGKEALHRRAAATARTMLIAAAAARWKVKPAACTAAGHVVTNTRTGATLGFGELASEASRLKVPDGKRVVLRPDAELAHWRKDMPDVDGRAITDGSVIFGADVSVDGMVIAVIARPPVVGGKVARLDPARALAIPGVVRVIPLDPPGRPWLFQHWGGVAVLATNTWAAKRGRAALDVTWEHGANASYDSVEFRKTLTASVSAPGKALRSVGDVDRALASATRVVEADYHVPHLAHVPMEPPVALARLAGGRCEVWACTQDPQTARAAAASAAGLNLDQVTVHVTRLGGGFGRKSKPDFIVEAVLLAKLAGVPVRVQWTREDDLAHDYYNAVSTQRLTAGLGADGKVIAWRHRTAFPPIGTTFGGPGQPGAGDLSQGVLDLALDVPNVRAEACPAESHVRVGWLRSVYNVFHAFAVGSFQDELAHARGVDPKVHLLEVTGPERHVGLAELGVKELKNYGAPLAEHPVDAGRLRHVIEECSTRAGWSVSKRTSTLGLAAHRSFLAYVAVVASAARKPDGRVWIDEVWITIDAGRVMNVERLRSQMEGAVIFGLAHAFHGGITMKGGVTEQRGFRDHKLLRITDAPRAIHVQMIPSSRPPAGVGEPGVPPVAPAAANAIFALTGKRLRALPFELGSA